MYKQFWQKFERNFLNKGFHKKIKLRTFFLNIHVEKQKKTYLHSSSFNAKSTLIYTVHMKGHKEVDNHSKRKSMSGGSGKNLKHE